MGEDEVITAAEAIIPHLPALVGDEAPAVRAELAALFARSAAGELIKPRLLRVLAKRDPTREWTRRLLDVPLQVRAYEPIPGKEHPVRLPRYACPQGDQDSWFRFDVRDDVPTCPVHHVAYVRVG